MLLDSRVMTRAALIRVPRGAKRVGGVAMKGLTRGVWEIWTRLGKTRGLGFSSVLGFSLNEGGGLGLGRGEDEAVQIGADGGGGGRGLASHDFDVGSGGLAEAFVGVGLVFCGVAARLLLQLKKSCRPAHGEGEEDDLHRWFLKEGEHGNL